MKTITNITAAAVILISSVSANASATGPKTFPKYDAREMSFEIAESNQKPIEFVISENNQITESVIEDAYKIDAMAIEDVIREDQKIIEAVLPEVRPLDFKKIESRLRSKIANNKVLVYGNL